MEYVNTLVDRKMAMFIDLVKSSNPQLSEYLETAYTQFINTNTIQVYKPMEKAQCIYVFKKGNKQNTRCASFAQIGMLYCSKHKRQDDTMTNAIKELEEDLDTIVSQDFITDIEEDTESSLLSEEESVYESDSAQEEPESDDYSVTSV